MQFANTLDPLAGIVYTETGTELDLNMNQAKQFVLEALSGDPTPGNQGRIVTNGNKKDALILDDGTGLHFLRDVSKTLGEALSWDGTNNEVDVNRSGAIGLNGSNQLFLDASATEFTNGVKAVSLSDMAAPTGHLAMNDKRITGMADPVDPKDAVNKRWAEDRLAGIKWKNSVVVTSTSNITLSGTQTIDNIPVEVGDRVLVQGQTSSSENGIYVVSATAWSRASDADSWSELVSAAVWVEEGTGSGVGEGNEDTGWTCTIDSGGGSLDVDDVNWSQFTGAAGVVAGDGLSKTGNTIDVSVDGMTIEVDSNDDLSVLLSEGLITDTAGIAVNVDDQTIEILSNELAVKLSDGLTTDVDGIKIDNNSNHLVFSGNTLELNLDDTAGITSSVDGVAVNISTDFVFNNSTGELELATDFRTKKYTETILSADTSTDQTITHNLGTEDIVVTIREDAGDKEAIIMDWKISTSNAIIVSPNDYGMDLQVTIIG